MKRSNVLLIAKQFWSTTFKSTAVYATMLVFALLLFYAAYTGYKNYVVQNEIRRAYQHKARDSWEANPDKHPHRMAHFGSFAFRTKHPLTLFDFGMESYTGNAVFLEAHKQNTVNFSEASFSTGLLRFGEISMAMLLQLILPLVIFFLGFGAVAAERESRTLKMVLTQGGSWKEIIVGKTIGLMSVALLFYLPVLLVTSILLGVADDDNAGTGKLWRFGGIALSYFLFYWIISAVAVSVSALSKTSKESLIKLLGIWLVIAILMPKLTQAAGSTFHPSPSKIEFETAVEKDLIQEGDSHNPDDPHYKAIKDSVLRANRADSIQQLSFNYGGFIMQEGERLSATIYNRHLQTLLNTYEAQNNVSSATAWVNPLMAVRNISMLFSASDFYSYTNFQSAAEAYRYRLAQEMNVLQMKYISNKKQGANDKPYSISRSHWQSFPDFKYRHLAAATVFENAVVPLLALAAWGLLSFLMIVFTAKKAKAI